MSTVIKRPKNEEQQTTQGSAVHKLHYFVVFNKKLRNEWNAIKKACFVKNVPENETGFS